MSSDSAQQLTSELRPRTASDSVITRQSALQVVLNCAELPPNIEFFCDKLEFRISTIFPADDPKVAELSGYGMLLRLQKSEKPDTTRLRLNCSNPEKFANGESRITAPNGTTIELVGQNEDLVLPELAPCFVITRGNSRGNWVEGRAGMQYRDLIPDRQGGRFIASHIRIPGGGPVPDYVHFHKIHFQMIYCYKGWVKVVYEDQGDPFVMEAGDCVLQPPRIRHRVLESSPGLEVVEIGCPADHITCVDHELALPTNLYSPERDFSGQRFVRHQAKTASWQPWRLTGFNARDIGINQATSGLAGATVVRLEPNPQFGTIQSKADLLFWFVLKGELGLLTDGRDHHSLHSGDSVVIPREMDYSVEYPMSGTEVLEISLPG